MSNDTFSGPFFKNSFPNRKPSPQWWHTIEEPIPPQFLPKSLGGNQRLLAQWICPLYGVKPYGRNLQGLALDNILWIVKSTRRRYCQVHFRVQDQDKYAEANGKRLVFADRQKRA